MENENLQDINVDAPITYINARVRYLFRDMLNQIGEAVKLGNTTVKYGNALYNLDQAAFQSLYNRWVTKCCEKNIMVIINDNSSTKYLKWSDELSEVERAFKGMEVLKEML